ncbi:hypothetical protein E1212_27310 [Jiangella ureilytica]|uniref:Uncharacterized protein n=1 Tax=Jiangella ureilytica TaxID=2530374 RepID=A0A4R4RAR5_9ACTN|nr:hypothetical protein [Jiangella ureilytica]TDC46231.1 hypothetical protein E1212_27310 [Jiangella ureilytica]
MSSLETDLAGISLSGPAAARRRAAQRTRHQVTGGVLAGVAAVALGVFAISPPDFVASPEPVGPVTDSPTTGPTTPSEPPSTPPVEPTPDPSETGSPDGGGQNGSTGNDGTSSLMVPPDALLTLDDVITETSEGWAEAGAGDSWLPCVPGIPSDGVGIAFESAYGSRFEQVVDPIAGGAEDRLEDLRAELTECAESGDDFHLVQVWSLSGVGDGGYLIVWNGPPTTPDTATYVTASLVRTGDFVSAVFHGGPGQDYNAPAQPRQAVLSAERLCRAMGSECPASPEQERLYPEPVSDVDGWLTIDDLAEVGLTALTEGSEVMDSGDAGGATDYGFVGLERDPFADGAESLEQRTYTDPLEPGGQVVNQLRATFPDAETARAHHDALAAAAEQPTQPGDVVENTGSISGAGYHGTVWVLSNTEFGTSWLYGAAVSGNVVTVVYYGLIDDELSPDQMSHLLELAAQRIGG